MLRAFYQASHVKAKGHRANGLSALGNQVRQLRQAIRFGDLSEAKVAFERIRCQLVEHPNLSLEAQMAFDSLGEAIDSGSLSESADGLRMLRLVLETQRDNPRGAALHLKRASDDLSPETLRSSGARGVADELPETATVFEIDGAG